MSSIPVAEANATLTAGGGTDGYVTVASNADFHPGCEAWLNNAAGTLPQRCLVTDLSGATKIGLRFLTDIGVVGYPTYIRSNCSAYLAGAKISMPAQVARVNDAYSKRQNSET